MALISQHFTICETFYSFTTGVEITVMDDDETREAVVNYLVSFFKCKDNFVAGSWKKKCYRERKRQTDRLILEVGSFFLGCNRMRVMSPV